MMLFSLCEKGEYIKGNTGDVPPSRTNYLVTIVVGGGEAIKRRY